ncbi:hypothetical protein [Streptomyces sp. NPDC007100]|uniref:hypothetical protein n=1 Tax=Streptomyces sp. NPDC007100 TaxID=3155602 RepID=UPI0033E45A82
MVSKTLTTGPKAETAASRNAAVRLPWTSAKPISARVVTLVDSAIPRAAGRRRATGGAIREPPQGPGSDRRGLDADAQAGPLTAGRGDDDDQQTVEDQVENGGIDRRVAQKR